MKVTVTLRYLRKTLVEIKTEEEVPAGYTAGELSSSVIKAHEKQEGIEFAGASIVTLINGKLAAPDQLLSEGDDIKIMPVAAAG